MEKHIVALSNTRVAKLLFNNSYTELEMEAERIKYANSVNDLIVKFIDLKRDKDGNNLMILERIFPCQYRAFDKTTKLRFLEEFEAKLKELHLKGFAHRDLGGQNVTYVPGNENYMLTRRGIRLIDAGNCCLYENTTDELFKSYIAEDIDGLEYIKTYIFRTHVG